MVKVKVISRSRRQLLQETPGTAKKVLKNTDPAIHPFEKPREFVRAMNAVKMEKMFAKPFVGAMSGHLDGVVSMARHPTFLPCFVSGGAEGEIRVWDIASRTCVNEIQGHEGLVRGLCMSNAGHTFFSCGSDNVIKQWPLLFNQGNAAKKVVPMSTYPCKHSIMYLDHQRANTVFASAGFGVVQIWSHERSTPIESYQWGDETLNVCKFNPIEQDLLVSCGNERAITLYDLRRKTPIRKLVTKNKVNSISWNPMVAYQFATGSEDSNVYTYDARFFTKASKAYRGHFQAVMDVDFSPTGLEVVSCSFDRSIRIWPLNHIRARDVYHTQRMQRCWVSKFSVDSRFIVSGSSDGNVRVWKANASEPLKLLTLRDQMNRDYKEKLIDRYKHVKPVRSIHDYHHLPKQLNSMRTKRDIMVLADQRKRLRAHPARQPGAQNPVEPLKPITERDVVTVIP
ncbi:DDB1- and CUL4-associated factor 13 [Pelomyxa schiedti]|nr:DDB1- and CUL4-associated factor 13 [Pelomyxa schiedti]